MSGDEEVEFEGEVAPFYNIGDDVTYALSETRDAADAADGGDVDATKKWGPVGFYMSGPETDGPSSSRRAWPPTAIVGDAVAELQKAVKPIMVLGQKQYRLHPREAGRVFASNILPSNFCLLPLPPSASSDEKAFLASTEGWTHDPIDDAGIKKNNECFVAYLNMVFGCKFDAGSLGRDTPDKLLQLGLIGNILSGTVLSSGVDEVSGLMSESPKMANFLLKLYVQVRTWVQSGFRALNDNATDRRLLQSLLSARADATMASAFRDIIASAGAFRVIQSNPFFGPVVKCQPKHWPSFVTWFQGFTTATATAKEGLLVMDPAITETEDDDGGKDTDASVCVSSLKKVLESGRLSATSGLFVTHVAGLSNGARNSSEQAKATLAKVMAHPDLTTHPGNVIVSIVVHNVMTRAVNSLRAHSTTSSLAERLFELEYGPIKTCVDQGALARIVGDADLGKAAAALLCIMYAGREDAKLLRTDVEKRLLVHGGVQWGQRFVDDYDEVLGDLVGREVTLAVLQAIDTGIEADIPDSFVPWFTTSDMLPPSEHKPAAVRTMDDVRALFPKKKQGPRALADADHDFVAEISTSAGRRVVVECEAECLDGDSDDDSTEPPVDGRRVAVPFFALPARGESVTVLVKRQGTSKVTFARFVLDDASMCPYSGTVVGTNPGAGGLVVAQYEVMRSHTPGLMLPDDEKADTQVFDTQVLGAVSSRARVGPCSLEDARKSAGANGVLVRLIVNSPSS